MRNRSFFAGGRGPQPASRASFSRGPRACSASGAVPGEGRSAGAGSWSGCRRGASTCLCGWLGPARRYAPPLWAHVDRGPRVGTPAMRTRGRCPQGRVILAAAWAVCRRAGGGARVGRGAGSADIIRATSGLFAFHHRLRAKSRSGCVGHARDGARGRSVAHSARTGPGGVGDGRAGHCLRQARRPRGGRTACAQHERIRTVRTCAKARGAGRQAPLRRPEAGRGRHGEGVRDSTGARDGGGVGQRVQRGAKAGPAPSEAMLQGRRLEALGNGRACWGPAHRTGSPTRQPAGAGARRSWRLRPTSC